VRERGLGESGGKVHGRDKPRQRELECKKSIYDST
jgi:hypothetical protein